MKLKKSDWIALAVIGVIIIGIAAMYFTFYYSYKCNDLPCYMSHQKECSRTTFIKDSEDTTWKYFVTGKQDGKCGILVEVLSVKAGTADKQRLEGKTMECLLPLGSTASPESDIAKCHGELKEEMQNLIIQKLHSYILENLGEIGGELSDLI
jgi:hypothetical protein